MKGVIVNMGKLIRNLFLMAFFIIIIVLSIVIYGGYSLYKETTNKVSMSDKIAEIQSSEDFISIEDVPDYYKNAVIAVEDHRFYEHGAVDGIAITRALSSNIKNKDLIEGGSTITQQVVKNMYFMDNPDDSLNRKIAEIIMGIKLENEYSKDEIFELYMNNIYYGDGYYNIKDACKGYFNKKTSEITLYEATLLAGVPNAPSVYSPNVNPELCKQRQKKVIKSMVKYGYLTQEEADEINLNEYFE